MITAKKDFRIHFQANLKRYMTWKWKYLEDIVTERDGFFRDVGYGKMQEGLIFSLKVK